MDPVGGADSLSLPFESITVGSHPAISVDLLDNLGEAIDALASIDSRPDALSKFIVNFLSRYGNDEVELGEVLDSQYGIGFDDAQSGSESPLLAGIRFTSPSERPVSWTARDTFLVRKLQDAGGRPLQLSQRELLSAGLAPARALSGAFAAIATIFAKSEEAFAVGDVDVRLREVRGPTGLEHIAHGEPRDAAIISITEDHARADRERAPEAIVAFVLNGAEGPGRIDYPWVIACSPDVPMGRNVLPLSDLLVTVIGERVHLFSKRLNREVLPRLVAPTSHGAGVMRFLEAVQSQGTPFPLRWQWGAWSLEPRVGDRISLPSVRVGRVTLYRDAPEEPSQGTFSADLVVPYLLEAVPAPRAARQRRRTIKRAFEPGSQWLQAHIYANPNVADEVLREAIEPFFKRETTSADLQTWYFYRYVDPHFHLRFRFCGGPTRLVPGLMEGLRQAIQPLIEDRRVWRWSIDTYTRDIGRYGGEDGLLVAEKVFHADSEAVLKLVAAGDQGDGAVDAAFFGTHLLLEDLRLSPEERDLVLHDSIGEVRRRFSVDGEVQRQLAAKFESERSTLRHLLGNGDSKTRPALTERSRRLRSLFAQLKQLELDGKLNRPVREQAFSYLHMFLNRLFATNSLAQELIVYELLRRHYAECKR
jgi:thiopeptide-type bacteriocin biosynthesis protein